MMVLNALAIARTGRGGRVRDYVVERFDVLSCLTIFCCSGKRFL